MSIACQEVRSIASFSYQFDVHEMALFGGFFDPNFPNYCPILMKFPLEVVFKDRQSVVKNFWKIQILTETGDTHNFHFWSNFDPPFLPENGLNQKK